MNLSILPLLALTSMALLFGLSFVATKYALAAIPPFTLVFLRFFIAGAILWALYSRSSRGKIEKEDRGRIFLISLIVPGVYFLTETYGLKLSSAASVSLMVATVPIFGSLFALLILKEKVPLRRGSGIALSVIGVAAIILSAPGTGAVWRMNVWGSFLGLGAAASAGLYIALGRKMLIRYPALSMTTFQAGSAVMIFFPLAVMEGVNQQWGSLDRFTVGAVVYLALFCSVLAFFLWNYGISRVEAAKAAAFANLVPVFTVFGAYFLLGEQIQSMQITGGVLVLCGVMLASI